MPTFAPAGASVRRALAEGWWAAPCAPGEHERPETTAQLDWIEASVPGTAAGALRAAGRWRVGEPYDFDAQDWWFRVRFEEHPAHAQERVLLRLGGLATLADVYLNGQLVLRSESMFAAHALDVGEQLADHNELAIRCRALGPALQVSRRPRARWRSSLGAPGNLRFFRTMLLGRAPGLSPGPAAVGPWRPVWLERRRSPSCSELRVRTRCEGDTGVLSVTARLERLGGTRAGDLDGTRAGDLDGARAGGLDAAWAGDLDGGARANAPFERALVELDGPSGAHSAELAVSEAANGETLLEGELRVARVARWWPHTHGEPALHTVALTLEQAGEQPLRVAAGRVGFRELAAGAGPTHELLRDGLDLHVNGVRTFVRGAVWTPPDPVQMSVPREQVREALAQARAAGMNMLRVPGTGAYEGEDFHELCDELGIMVWQDFMFANFDYPLADERFGAQVRAEAAAVLAGIAPHPSLAVLCGNSEVEQQVGMLGLDPALARGELFDELLPQAAAEAGADVPYLPSAPCGSTLAFRPARGVANYFGVGAYRRPLEDARRAGVRFASECLAFANVPAQRAELTAAQQVQLLSAPRDAGAAWDHGEIRDHYLGVLFGEDAPTLRREDPERFLALSRALTGEIMGEVLGEWRRAGSPCAGALVLWLRDVSPGAGWGVVDHDGVPKPAYHHLRRALAPVAVWSVDEGLGGVVAHVANDPPRALSCELRMALYGDGERALEEVRLPLELAAHGAGEWDVEELLGRFVDASWAYRFGPPAQQAIALSLERAGERSRPLSHSVRFPAGRPLRRESGEALGLSGELRTGADGEPELALRSRRLAYGVSIELPGFQPDDDWLTLEPGVERVVSLRPLAAGTPPGGTLSALNMSGRVRVQAQAGHASDAGAP